MSCWCFNIFPSGGSNNPSRSQDLVGLSTNKKIKLFSYKELATATNNFQLSNKIGRGGFGIVFKGTLKNGIQIAAKVLSASSKQGVNEFVNEIDTIANIKHPNLVELIGYCIEGSNRILVYEYAENRCIYHALLGPDRETTFDWSRRSAICIGTAKGLKFLHEEVVPNIVHRDIKASNVLLDSNFVPKIGDFGLAKLFPDDITHISTRVAGTTGYLAPEYAVGGRLTKKADIYSFGVLILEIISGRSTSTSTLPHVEQFLLKQTWQLYEERKLVEVIDPSLIEYPEEEVLKYIKVALFCTQGRASRRPPMPVVLDMLTNRVRLNEKQLTPPGLIQDQSGIGEGSKMATSIMGSKDVSSATAANASFSEIIPR